MKTGWLISNGSLRSPLYEELNNRYQQAANLLGISLQAIFNHELLIGIASDQVYVRGKMVEALPDFILFLDKDLRLAYQLEALGLRLFNRAAVIEACDDKARTFQVLAGKGIHMPETVFAPLVFRELIEDLTAIEGIEALLGYPIVVKECFGSFGQQVYLAQDRAALMAYRKQLAKVPHLYQKFVAYSRGRDVRLYVVGDEVVASMLRVSEEDFRANITNGGLGANYVPDPSFVQMALDVKDALQADFLGVDILFEDEKTPVLCEVNSNAHIKAIETCCQVDVAQKILAYIIEAIK